MILRHLLFEVGTICLTKANGLVRFNPWPSCPTLCLPNFCWSLCRSKDGSYSGVWFRRAELTVVEGLFSWLRVLACIFLSAVECLKSGGSIRTLWSGFNYLRISRSGDIFWACRPARALRGEGWSALMAIVVSALFWNVVYVVSVWTLRGSSSWVTSPETIRPYSWDGSPVLPVVATLLGTTEAAAADISLVSSTALFFRCPTGPKLIGWAVLMTMNVLSGWSPRFLFSSIWQAPSSCWLVRACWKVYYDDGSESAEPFRVPWPRTLP